MAFLAWDRRLAKWGLLALGIVVALALAAIAIWQPSLYHASLTQNSRDTKIAIATYSPDGLHDVLAGSWKTDPSTIDGIRYLPEDAGAGPFPAVVVHHGSDHVYRYKDWLERLVPALLNGGIAAFVLDSYTGRWISGTARDQTKLSKAARIVDAYRALEVLAARSDIDADRIGITGYSFGGIVALYTAHRGLTATVVADRAFAAHAPVYPSCQSQFRELDFTKAPIMIIAGEIDNYTPAKYCSSFVERLQAAGYDAEIKIYPDAHHAVVGAKPRADL